MTAENRKRAPKAHLVIPAGVAGDEWRERALAFVVEHYRTHHADLFDEITYGTSGEPWSKGAAVRAAVDEISPAGRDVLVIADADSYVTNPAILADAVELVSVGRKQWVTPHRSVFRLKQAETERLYSDPTRRARVRQVVRTPYIGPIGGGITVLSAEAFERVGGIDERFEGWGGEDVAFGWMLETLVGPHTRLAGNLVHLWHPHPAPTLRGSPESEALVAQYAEARGMPRRCEALARREPWESLAPLPDPVRFRMTANRRTLRLFGSSKVLRFSNGTYVTRDPDEIEALRRIRIVREE